MSTDRIETKGLLRARRSRVWKALSDSKEFGTWFGMKFDRPFEAGKPISGVCAPTQVHPEVAKTPSSGSPSRSRSIGPSRRRSSPSAGIRSRSIPRSTTRRSPPPLVAFTLAEAPGGRLLTVTESGFDQIPLERGLAAFAADEVCWEVGTQLIELYLARVA
jgi:uncharacterized protein YndB with AHSA1/START domain